MTHASQYLSIVRDAQRVAQFCVACQDSPQGLLMARHLSKAGEDELHYRLTRFMNGAAMAALDGPHNIKVLYRGLSKRLELSYIDSDLVYRVTGMYFPYLIEEFNPTAISVPTLNAAGELLKMRAWSDEQVLQAVTLLLLQA